MNKDFIFIGRFFAIFGVILVHCTIAIQQSHPQNINLILYDLLYSGSYGVHLFFLISGYCLSNSYETRNEITFIYFYIRRIFRIIPLYYLLGILLYFVFRTLKYYYVNGVIFVDPMYNVKNIASQLFFIHGFVQSANNNIVPGGWSIANEMFYYLLFPFFIGLIKKKNKERKESSNLIFIVIFLLIFELLLKNFFISNNYLNFVFSATLSPVVFFIFGIFFYYHHEFFTNKIKMNYLFLSLVITCIIIIFIKNLILFGVFLSLFFIGILTIIKNMNKSNFFLRKILVNYGKYSYTAYLSHFLIINCVKYFILDKYLYALNVYFALIIFISIVLVIVYIFSSILSNTIEKKFISLGKYIIKYFKLNYQIK